MFSGFGLRIVGDSPTDLDFTAGEGDEAGGAGRAAFVIVGSSKQAIFVHNGVHKNFRIAEVEHVHVVFAVDGGLWSLEEEGFAEAPGSEGALGLGVMDGSVDGGFFTVVEGDEAVFAVWVWCARGSEGLLEVDGAIGDGEVGAI